MNNREHVSHTQITLGLQWLYMQHPVTRLVQNLSTRYCFQKVCDEHENLVIGSPATWR